MTMRYTLDAKQSRFTVQAFAGGLLSAFGHNPVFAIREFAGQVEFDPQTLDTASLVVNVKADSLEVIGDISAKDRRDMESQMREEVLETAKYPEIVFQSTDVALNKIMEGHYHARINGDLSLHGVTSSEEIDAQVIVYGTTLRAHGEFTLRQTDYHIKLVTAVGGTLKLKNELKFSFDIVAHAEQ